MFLRLPFLIQLNIIDQLELYELFFLGICSKRTKHLVRRSLFKFDNVVINAASSHVQLQKIGLKRINLVMYSAKNKLENMHLRHDVSFWDERIKLHYRDKTIRCRISLHPTERIPILWCKSKYSRLLPMAIHSYICDVFNLPTTLQIIFKLDNLEEFPDTLEVDNLSEWATPPRDNYATFFNSICVRNGLKLRGLWPMDADHKIWKIKYLMIDAAIWITREHLLCFQGCSAVFSRVDLITNEDLVAFIQNWLDGNTFDKNVILQNFDVSSWDPKNRSRRFMYPPGWSITDVFDIADCSEGMDLERKSDGLLATVMITPNYFRFFVWHERFPDPLKNTPVIKVATENAPEMVVVGKLCI